jgi:hypothetical protein
MPSAAPGEIARGAVRRNLPDYLVVPVHYFDRCRETYPHYPGMEAWLNRFGNKNSKGGTFTQQFSGFGVERGRLGEVVSLVGDCRPPPPGNPHQPPICKGTRRWAGGHNCTASKPLRSGSQYRKRMQPCGVIIYPVWMHFSFNRYKKPSNLKILNSSEYFKINRSYFYCTENEHVLESGSFHSHLCGLKEVELPSIAITNVLEMQVIDALPLL